MTRKQHIYQKITVQNKPVKIEMQVKIMTSE